MQTGGTSERQRHDVAISQARPGRMLGKIQEHRIERQDTRFERTIRYRRITANDTTVASDGRGQWLLRNANKDRERRYGRKGEKQATSSIVGCRLMEADHER